MATTYKKSQVQGTASTGSYATLYGPVPVSTSSIISTIAICNTASTSATFRIGIMGTEGSPSAANWIVYEAPIVGYDTIYITNGIVMIAGDYMRISSSANTITFSLYYAEVS